METDKLSFSFFKKNSLIELVLLPDSRIDTYVQNFRADFEKIIIFDTVGNLNEKYSSIGCNQIHYYFLTSIDNFVDCIAEVKKYKDFLLVIDNIAFICDTASSFIKQSCSLIWSIIYQCNATVIALNTYRVGKLKRGYGLVPRMGGFWEKIVSYRVRELFKYRKKYFQIQENIFEHY